MGDRIQVPLDLDFFEVVDTVMADGHLEVTVRSTFPRACFHCGSTDVIGHGRHRRRIRDRAYGHPTTLVGSNAVFGVVTVAALRGSGIPGLLERNGSPPGSVTSSPRMHAANLGLISVDGSGCRGGESLTPLTGSLLAITPIPGRRPGSSPWTKQRSRSDADFRPSSPLPNSSGSSKLSKAVAGYPPPNSYTGCLKRGEMGSRPS